MIRNQIGSKIKWHRLLLVSFSLLLLACSTVSVAIDLTQVEKDLAGPGARGWVHGAVSDRKLYVFTVRDPHDFFDHVEMSLVTDKPELLEKLAKLDRHDEVLIKGEFMDNPSPQKHIELASVEVIKKYDSGYPVDEYKYEAKIPDDLLNVSQARFLVHAVAAGGQILVVEYKDQVLPIYVHNAELTKKLFRNDVVELMFKIRKKPPEPTHLVLLEDEPGVVKMVDSIREKHGKPVTVEGQLVLFPKSPEIKFAVFAVNDEAFPDCKRQFTLLNNQDAAVFTKIREKLQKAWDQHPGYDNGRNKLISRRVRVRATGTFNEVDPGQANGQILLESADQVSILD